MGAITLKRWVLLFMVLLRWHSGKEPACQCGEMQVLSLGQEDPRELEMATHSSLLAWKNSIDRGGRWATAHGVTKNRTQLSMHAPVYILHVKKIILREVCWLAQGFTEGYWLINKFNKVAGYNIKWNSLSRVWLFATPRTIQPMEFFRPEYWNG